MRLIRQIHLYLGCLFAPLLIYFAVSGAWQVFRLNDLPKNEPASEIRTILHALSNPHTHSTLPGADPKTEKSGLFDVMAALAAAGLITTSVLGIVLAVRFAKRPGLAYLALGAGVFVPVLMLLLH